jgi:hypothetical protein
MNEINKNNIITPFAATNFRERRVFGIKTDDRRRHMYIIGKTGMGKSTLLENLVYSDILNGNGVAYVDPHGDTAEKILQWIPQERVQDVIYFNPADRNFPIAFNVLEKVDPEYRDNVASGLVSVYKKLWADSWGPRLEYILRYCILALLDSPDSTLLGINRMLVDEKYRNIVVARVQDPVVRSFWEDEFTKWNDRVIAEVISPIQNKVGQFLSNGMIRNIVGQQRSSFSLREVMDQKKILILNLSKGAMGEDASALLGAMMITKIQLAAMSRVNIPEDDREDFYLYVDEFQNFATEAFATILSEARKYRLCLTMAHQYIAQLEDGGSTVVRDAVFGNVGTLVTFRVGASDAEFLEKEFAPQFTLEDIVNLPKYKIYLRLMIDGMATEPFSADALGPRASVDLGNSSAVIEHTRATYATSKEEVTNTIIKWQGAEGGVIDPEMLNAHVEDATFNRPSVVEVFEAQRKKDEEKAKKEQEKNEEREKRASRPVVWRGVCDAHRGPLELKFIPDPTRPILCPEDLRLFRKGEIKGENLERLTDVAASRKARFLAGASKEEILGGEIIYENLDEEQKKDIAQRGGSNNNNSNNNGKNNNNNNNNKGKGGDKNRNNKDRERQRDTKPRNKMEELPPIAEGKPQIRIVKSEPEPEEQEQVQKQEQEQPQKQEQPQSNVQSVKPGEKIEF